MSVGTPSAQVACQENSAQSAAALGDCEVGLLRQTKTCRMRWAWVQRPLGGWAATALRQLGWAMATPTGAVRTWIVVTTVLLVVSRT